jgi:7-cyano-7-deazaguanine synthase
VSGPPDAAVRDPAGEASAEPAVVLLSGGLDSAVVLAAMRRRGHPVVAISFDYGQRHRFELSCAARLAEAHGAREHRIVPIDLRAFGGSALTDEIDVPKDRDLDGEDAAIPVTYVPARNTVFLSLALALAESRGARHLAIGVNEVDYSGYPDCRPEFVAAFERLANLATRDGVVDAARGRRHFELHTPLAAKSKAEIVRLGIELGVDFGMTTSCYDPAPTGTPCRRCDACRLRAKGFAEAGVEDPALRRD